MLFSTIAAAAAAVVVKKDTVKRWNSVNCNSVNRQFAYIAFGGIYGLLLIMDAITTVNEPMKQRVEPLQGTKNI